MQKILIIEDDINILTGLADNLKIEGYEVLTAGDGKAGLRLALECAPDLVVLDVMLPELNGFEVCKALRGRGIDIPIIILSARGQETDKVMGLDVGADDYISKPFSLLELLMRIKAVLRRASQQEKGMSSYEFGDVKVNFAACEVSRGKKEIKLTAAEFKVLNILISARGKPVSRERLLRDIWGENVTSRTVDTHVWKLREKVEHDPANPKHIITMHGVGYKFVE